MKSNKIFRCAAWVIYLWFGMVMGVQAQFPTLESRLLPKPKMDSVSIKKLVKVSCSCFQDLTDIVPPSFDYEDRQSRERMDSLRSIAQAKGTKVMNCMLERMKDQKAEMGWENVPDSLFVIRTLSNGPPEFFQLLSPSIALYAVRDCPHIFNFAIKMIDTQQAGMERRRIRIDSLEKVRLADTVGKRIEAEVEEDYVNSYSKRIKGTLKRVETKGYAYLVIDREDAQGKKYEEKFLILYKPDDEEDIIKNFKQYKGKEVKIRANKQDVFNAKTNQYDTVWRLSMIELLQKK